MKLRFPAHSVLLTASITLASTAAVHATIYDFTGTTNGAWHTATNWQGGVTPTFNNVADLKFGVNFAMSTNASWLSTSNRTVRSLEFGNISSPLTINLGSDNSTTTARSLTLDTDSGNATILVNSTVSANVTIGGPAAIGTIVLADNLAVTNNSTTSTLTLNRPISETGGAKSLTKDGVGILQLGNANSFTGKTTVNGGVVRINLDNRLGTAPGSYVADQLTLNGGTLRTFAGFTMDANRGITLGASGGAIDVTTGELTYAGKITGNGALVTSSSDTTPRALNLEAANDYSGNTTISNGVLRLQGNGTLTGTSNIAINGSGNFNVRTNPSVNWVYSGTITGDGTGQINLNSGTNAELAGDISGVAIINANSSTTNTKISGDISGNTTVNVQSGGGVLTLSGTNTYSGNTTVANTGTLIVNGDNSGATGNVTVSSGGTLKGSGVIGGNVTISGILAPGNSIESLGVGNVSFTNGSTFAYELDSNSLNGDLVASTGTLDIAGVSTLTLTEMAAGTLAIGSKLTLISYFGGWTGGELFTYNASTLADDSTFTLGANTWLFNYNDTTGGTNFTGDQLGATSFVTMTVVPEPSAALLGGLGLLALLRRRRD